MTGSLATLRFKPSRASGPRGTRFASSLGFTLIEVLVVMTIIVVLATVGLAQYSNSVKRSSEAVLKTDLFQIREAIDQYYADKGKYPASLDALAEDRYIRGIPTDPFTHSADTWQTVLSDPEAGNPTAEIGVFDVKSGSDLQALDGSRYSEW